jgi:hypothetical protein
MGDAMTGHYPTPWSVSPVTTGQRGFDILCDVRTTPNKWSIAASSQEQANAAFIVKACNNFDGLLAALELLVADVADYETWQRPCHAVDVAKAAIAKAREATP